SSLDGRDRAIQLAEEYAGQILAKAGVGVRWVNCRPGGSPQIRGPNDFGFHIRKEMPPDYSHAALGFASIVHPFGVASYSRIEAVAFRRHMAVAPILGAVMAHEIGHWLLGANAHSPHGVMRGNWRDYEFTLATCRALAFTPEQNAQLRWEVIRR